MRCEELEIYLSGYLDRELPQRQAQLVELHVSGCTRCEAVLGQLRKLKESTAQLTFDRPNNEELGIMQTRVIERISRGLGWLIVVVWLAGTLAYGLYAYASAPDEPITEKLWVFSLFLGVALLFFSVLAERLRERRTDRYKGVEK